MEKSLVVFSICLFKSVESIEDLYHGEYHRNNRLDIGCILQTFRYIISIIILIIGLLLTKNLVVSNFIATIVTFIIFIYQNVPFIKYYIGKIQQFDFYRFKQLLLISLPVCIGGYVSSYILNLPKYTIDSCLNQVTQTYYGVLVMPVVVINMLSIVVYRPMITSMSNAYFKNDMKTFRNIIVRQILVIILLTVLAVIGGYVIGLNLLGIIYGIDLTDYMMVLVILLIGGGINATAGFLNVVLTIQRKQNLLLLSYIVTLGISYLIAKPLIVNFKMIGAAMLYLISSLIMVILFAFCICFCNKKKELDKD